MAIPYQTEIDIDLPTSQRLRSTIRLSPGGDIQLVTGRDKLLIQLVRAVINEQAISENMINAKGVSARILNTLLNTIARNFRANQIKYVRKSDPDLTGFAIWRKAAGSDDDYVKVSSKAIVHKFEDSNLENGTVYSYGYTKIYKNVFETKFIDTIEVTPSAFTRRQDVSIGQSAVAVPGDRSVTFYVDYNKRFKASELLDKIQDINVIQDQNDPRQFTVNLRIIDYQGNPLDISSVRSIPAGSL